MNLSATQIPIAIVFDVAMGFVIDGINAGIGIALAAMIAMQISRQR